MLQRAGAERSGDGDAARGVAGTDQVAVRGKPAGAAAVRAQVLGVDAGDAVVQCVGVGRAAGRRFGHADLVDHDGAAIGLVHGQAELGDAQVQRCGTLARGRRDASAHRLLEVEQRIGGHSSAGGALVGRCRGRIGDGLDGVDLLVGRTGGRGGDGRDGQAHGSCHDHQLLLHGRSPSPMGQS